MILLLPSLPIQDLPSQKDGEMRFFYCLGGSTGVLRANPTRKRRFVFLLRARRASAREPAAAERETRPRAPSSPSLSVTPATAGRTTRVPDFVF